MYLETCLTIYELGYENISEDKIETEGLNHIKIYHRLTLYTVNNIYCLNHMIMHIVVSTKKYNLPDEGPRNVEVLHANITNALAFI